MDSPSPKRLLGACAALLTLGALAPPAHATLPGKNGVIAFAHSAPPIAEPQNVFTINPDGSELRNLTNVPANSSMPVWSPDGTRLAFRSDLEPSGVGQDNDYNLFTIDVAGGRITRLTNVESASGATWSPDGGALAYAADDFIWRVDSDGTDTRLLAAGRAPDWSPDGSRIAFTTEDGHLSTMSPDGTDQRRLTSSFVIMARWSPDGSRLAFWAVRLGPSRTPYGGYAVGVVNANGTGERIVSQSPDGALWPDWSPDGRRIAYFGDSAGNVDIYTVNADGSGGARLTTEPDFERAPTWSPDGRSIAYLDLQEVDGISVMNADGTGQRFLTEGYGAPVWQSLPNPPHYCRALGKRGRELAKCVQATLRGRR